MAFTNFTKDANRASKSLGGLTKSFSGLNKVIGFFGLYRVSQALIGMIGSAMDMIETANLFSVAMGDVAVETNNTLVEMTKLTGLDLTNVQTAVGTYSSLARSMGLTTEQAQTLSTTSYRLALDLASLYNVDINQALGDLRSGLVGQSETVYKYGIDVTEASLKTEALAQGIGKSVRNMSQGEKMALRYAVMIRQTSLAQTDFARTIEQPANQLRILKERFITLSRSIGNLFIPMLSMALPYLNAMAIVLIRIANIIAGLIGAELPEITNITSSLGSGGEELADGLDDANSSAKKLKGQLMGFDEINLWTPPSEGGSAGIGAISGGTGDFEMPTYDSGFENIKTKADEIAQTMINALKKISDVLSPIVTTIGSGFTWLLDNVLIPVGIWAKETVFPVVIDIIKNSLVVLQAVLEAISPPFLWLYENILVPIAQWTGGVIVDVLGWLAEKLLVISEWIKNNQPFWDGFVVTVFSLGITFLALKKAIDLFLGLKALVTGASIIMGGAIASLTSPVGLLTIGIGALIAIGILLVKNWEFIKESATTIFNSIKNFWDTWWANVEQQWADAMTYLGSAWEDMWRGVGNFFVGIANGIIQTFQNMTNGVIGMINDLIYGVNYLLGLLGSTYKLNYLYEVEFKKIPNFVAPPATKPMLRYANGGIPNYGEMFIAREAGAELVGGFGSKTAVMNNDQIVEAVSNGVYQAVSSAMQISTAGTQSGQPVVLNIDGKEFARMMLPKMDNETKRMGFKPILVRG